MKLLLDTHAFLWYITEDSRLSESLANAIRQKSNEVFLSVVSVWEILVKHQLGKLPLPAPPDEYIRDRREKHQVGSLALEEASLGYLLRLPMHHRDPFDRMLICQALYHDLHIVTVDQDFSQYPVSILPA
ncbi:MAG TPA: type II toxin-antitoxin system VapC family toxin [Thermoanaerobaculia bacterium]|nr:type II toxin-antitoxin system VapC family toxin [Thermoanaerobaculia bacterium]